MAQHVLGVAGAGQIDLNRGVDRDDIIIPRDDLRVVDIVDRCAHDCRIVVQEVVHRLLTHGESEDGLAAINCLAPVIDDPGAHEINEARI